MTQEISRKETSSSSTSFRRLHFSCNYIDFVLLSHLLCLFHVEILYKLLPLDWLLNPFCPPILCCRLFDTFWLQTRTRKSKKAVTVVLRKWERMWHACQCTSSFFADIVKTWKSHCLWRSLKGNDSMLLCFNEGNRRRSVSFHWKWMESLCSVQQLTAWLSYGSKISVLRVCTQS